MFYRVLCTGLQGPASVESATHQLIARMQANADHGAAACIDTTFARAKLMRAPFACKANGTQQLRVFDGPWCLLPWLRNSVKNSLQHFLVGLGTYFDLTLCPLEGAKHVSATRQTYVTHRRLKRPSFIQRSHRPAVDQYMHALVHNMHTFVGGPKASVRGIQLSSCKHQITYYVQNNKYCQNVARQHSSNHIFFVVDLARNEWCQRCFSCKGYSSRPQTLPPACRATPAAASQTTPSS